MNTSVLDDSQLGALIDAAEQAYAMGQAAEAARLLSMARAAAPENPAVLGALALHELRSQNPGDAKALLESAIRIDPTNIKLRINYASCMRALDDPTAELAALQEALTLDPYFYLANLQKGSLLEKQGKKKLAASAYHAALNSLRPGAQIPESLRHIIEHAQRCVRSHFSELEEWLQARMQATKDRYSSSSHDRVDECIAAFLGKKRIYVQQPTFTHFPHLPAITFFSRQDFAWLQAVEAATDDIRSELLQLSAEEFAPYVQHEPGAPLNQWRELNHSSRWGALFLFKNGWPVDANIARCPKTMEALKQVPLASIPGRAPAVFFSNLEPKTRIPPHTGVTNTRLIVHIPLIVPAGCGFRVGSDIREWQPGTALIFDDTIEHEAWNNSDQSRVVLIFDIWNPFLTEAERELMTVATTGIAEFYEDAATAPATP